MIVPTRNFTHREFALTLPNDVYIRYNSFANADEMKAQIVRMNPARFEIGPVYSGRVSLLPLLGYRCRRRLVEEGRTDVCGGACVSSRRTRRR